MLHSIVPATTEKKGTAAMTTEKNAAFYAGGKLYGVKTKVYSVVVVSTAPRYAREIFRAWLIARGGSGIEASAATITPTKQIQNRPVIVGCYPENMGGGR